MVTGTIEAEQFDRGGQSNGYYSLASTNSTNYRNSRMLISPCNDMPGGVTAGYCLDKTHASEWADYAINVLVTGTNVIDARVEGITATGGTFQFTASITVNGATITTGNVPQNAIDLA